jgi:hypothetical protein
MLHQSLRHNILTCFQLCTAMKCRCTDAYRRSSAVLFRGTIKQGYHGVCRKLQLVSESSTSTNTAVLIWWHYQIESGCHSLTRQSGFTALAASLDGLSNNRPVPGMWSQPHRSPPPGSAMYLGNAQMVCGAVHWDVVFACSFQPSACTAHVLYSTFSEAGHDSASCATDPAASRLQGRSQLLPTTAETIGLAGFGSFLSDVRPMRTISSDDCPVSSSSRRLTACRDRSPGIHHRS